MALRKPARPAAKAKAKAPAVRLATKKNLSPKPLAQKPAQRAKAPAAPRPLKAFTTVILLSPGAEVSAAEAELRLRTVARHLGMDALPPVLRVAEIDPTPDATALALYRTFRALGRGGPALYLAAGNPTEGALSLLITDWGNTFLAPNDGTLGLLAALFRQRRIPHTLTTLNAEALTQAEQSRMQNPDWQPAPDFSLRDLLAPAAAALLAGTPAARLAAPSSRTNPGGLNLHQTPFSERLQPLPLRLNDAVSAHTLPLGNGQWLVNLTLDPLSFDQLHDDKAQFTLTGTGLTKGWLSGLMPHSLLKLSGRHTLGVAGGTGHPAGPHLHLSPLPSPTWDERFLSLHLPEGVTLPSLVTLTRIR